MGTHRLGQSRFRHDGAGRVLPDILRSVLGAHAAGRALDVLSRPHQLLCQLPRHAERALAGCAGGSPRPEEALVWRVHRHRCHGHGAAGRDRCRSLGMGADRFCLGLDRLLGRFLVPGCPDGAGSRLDAGQPCVLAGLRPGISRRRPAVPVQCHHGAASALVRPVRRHGCDPGGLPRRRAVVDGLLAAAVQSSRRGAADRGTDGLARTGGHLAQRAA